MLRTNLKIALVLVGTGSFCQFSAQVGKIGVKTATPTEILDVNGTLRVNLPAVGTTGAIYTTGSDTNSGTSPTQIYNGAKTVVADANGVLGAIETQTSIPTNTAIGFNTGNLSTAMFVIKRFTVGDWPSGANTNTGVDTGMSLDRWEGIMSNVMYSFTSNIADVSTYIFTPGKLHGYRLAGQTSPGTWRIVGDINGINDAAVVDILFIRKNVVLADSRTN